MREGNGVHFILGAGCHAEPFGIAQGKLREASPFRHRRPFVNEVHDVARTALLRVTSSPPK